MIPDIIELDSLVDRILEVSSLITNDSVEISSGIKEVLYLDSLSTAKVFQIESPIYVDAWAGENGETF